MSPISAAVRPPPRAALSRRRSQIAKKKNKSDPALYKGQELIDGITDFCLVESWLELERVEKYQFKRMEIYLKQFPIYTEFLVGVKGIGNAMAAVIISELDPYKARYPSSFHKYAGLDVAHDGQGRSRKKDHLVEREYVDKEGKQATRVGITFSPWLKTKLIGVLGSSFLRAGENEYSRVYRDYKHRLENSPAHVEKSKGHRHAMATRYAVKVFLTHLHIRWRELEGLEVSAPYAEAKLGIYHRGESSVGVEASL